MQYLGYHANLPIKAGDYVMIPRGTVVKTMHPGRDSYVTTRAQKVRVNHMMCGQSYALHMIGEREARDFGLDMVALEKLRREDHKAFHNSYHHVSNPMVCWAGTGGYWCEVDINHVL